MAPRRFFLLASLVLAACLAGSGSFARNVSAIDLLDRYAAGQFPPVADALAGEIDYGELLAQLHRDAPAWIDAQGAEARPKRELGAATFALEAARAGAWHEWKVVQKQPPMCVEDWCYEPLNVLYWKAPPLLIEWGCELLRRHDTPRPGERWWQLAALAVAQRSEDPQFLVGDPNIGRGRDAGEIGNLSGEIKHLEHARARFPDESRFRLAEVIAHEIGYADQAPAAYRALERHPDIGGEAIMRLGALQMRQGDPAGALRSFEQAETLTRDPYVIYLARYFSAQIHSRERRLDRAERAYRAAAAAIPHARSATIPLAALTFTRGNRSEAQDLIRSMLDADPPPLDPWRTFMHADDRFWRRLIGKLREEILR